MTSNRRRSILAMREHSRILQMRSTSKPPKPTTTRHLWLSDDERKEQ